MTRALSQQAARGSDAWLRASGAVTGVGSVPHLDAHRAVEFVAATCPEVPFWPQLRRLSGREGMLPQSFGAAMRHLLPVRGEYEFVLPGNRVDRFAAALERDACRLDPANAAGFFAFVDAWRAGAFPAARAAKAQTMGPLTLACAITVEGQRAVEREDMFALIGDHVVRQAGWQVRTLQEFAPSVILMLDEAYLGMALRGEPAWRDRAVDMLRTVVLRIRRPGVAVGIHCCDRIPFSLLDSIGPDVYSFDAHRGAEAMVGDPDGRHYLAGGGRVAWGWIPTLDDLSGVSADAVVDRWWEVCGSIRTAAPDLNAARVLGAALVTASCGLAGSSEETCERSFALAAEVARGFARRCAAA